MAIALLAGNICAFNSSVSRIKPPATAALPSSKRTWYSERPCATVITVKLGMVYSKPLCTPRAVSKSTASYPCQYHT